MDLIKEWQKIQSETNHSSPLKTEEIMTAIYQDSKSSIEQVKKKIRRDAYIISPLLMLFVALNGYASRDNWAAAGLMGIIFICGMYLLWYGHQTAKKLTIQASPDKSPKSWLKANYEVLKKAMEKNRHFGNILFSVLALYFLIFKPMTWGTGLWETVTSTKYLILAVIPTVIIVPIAYKLAQRSIHKLIGKHVERLADNMKQLEEVE